MPLAAALLIGIAFGYLAARSHFCTMGALSDLFLFGSRRRLRGLVMAAAAALAGTCLLALAGLPVFLPIAEPPWLAVVAGGLCFGAGMTLAGGCITRNLVRAGQGSLRAAATLLVAALAATIALTCVASLPVTRLSGTTLPLSPPWLPWLGLVLAASAAGWCLFPAKERKRAMADLVTGAGLGVLVPLWRLLVVPDPLPISPAFLLPAADLAHALTGGDISGPGLALLMGTLAGAAVTGLLTGKSRLETFVDRADLARHLGGAVLMGIGGGLAGSCSFGLIVSGIGALLPAAFLGTIALALGCRQTLRVLEGRSFLSW